MQRIVVMVIPVDEFAAAQTDPESFASYVQSHDPDPVDCARCGGLTDADRFCSMCGITTTRMRRAA